MKHVLAVVRPYPDVIGRRARKLELDYLRLVYFVGEMRKQGENAQGYFIVIGDQMPKQMNKWEQDYRGKQCVQLVSTLPTSYVHHSVLNDKTTDLTRMVTAAILNKTAELSNSELLRDMEDYITRETILSLEPGVQQIEDKSRFPMGIRLDYYGVV